MFVLELKSGYYHCRTHGITPDKARATQFATEALAISALHRVRKREKEKYRFAMLRSV